MKQRFSKLTTQPRGGFRLYRAFTPEHNARRLQKHVDRLKRRPGQRHEQAAMKWRLTKLRIRRSRPNPEASV